MLPRAAAVWMLRDGCEGGRNWSGLSRSTVIRMFAATSFPPVDSRSVRGPTPQHDRRRRELLDDQPVQSLTPLELNWARDRGEQWWVEGLKCAR